MLKRQIFLFLILVNSIYSYEIYSNDTYEIAVYTEILSNDYFSKNAVKDHLECVNYCLNNVTCKSAKTDGYSCYMYNTTDVVLKLYSPSYWKVCCSVLKYPTGQKILYHIKAAQSYTYSAMFSFTTCYESCLKDPKCYAVGFKSSYFFTCYFFKEREYDKIGRIENFNMIFVRNIDDAEIIESVRLVNIYKEMHAFYERVCYEYCKNDENCKAVTFTRVNYTFSDKDYFANYKNISELNDCFLSDSATEFENDTNSVSYIKTYHTQPPSTNILTSTEVILMEYNYANRLNTNLLFTFVYLIKKYFKTF